MHAGCVWQGRCRADNPDSFMNHELLLPGHLFTIFVKEKLEEVRWPHHDPSVIELGSCLTLLCCGMQVMLAVLAQVRKECRDDANKVLASSKDGNYWAQLLTRHGSTLGKKVGHTSIPPLPGSSPGSLKLSVWVGGAGVVPSGHGQPDEPVRSRPDAGLGLHGAGRAAQLLPIRLTLPVGASPPHCPTHSPWRLTQQRPPYVQVHRGAFFAEMKTTTVRKLLPESFGFLCPVHTPDGSPCGLLNHLATAAVVLTSPPPEPLNPDLLVSLGVTPCGTGSADGAHVMPKNHIPVVLDGLVIGGATPEACHHVAAALRRLKVRPKPAFAPSASCRNDDLPLSSLPPCPDVFVACLVGGRWRASWTRSWRWAMCPCCEAGPTRASTSSPARHA